MIEWLESIPPVAIYLAVGLIIGLESVGIPLPGEILLVSASVAASQGMVNPVLLGCIAATGAIIGDSVGYAVGKKYGRGLLTRLGRRMPKHFGPKRIAAAERAFDRWGAWAVFGGRFVALLRILAGPLAGILGMQYRKFLLANATGGIAWAGTVTTVAYLFGVVAEHWIKRFSWVALLITVLIGVAITLYVRHRTERAVEAEEAAEADGAADAASPEEAAEALSGTEKA
ncbi:membrane protein DedA with SNARE-associated domain [Saccharopolyspora erythraea NRRL 2338]|uniref:Integral membrane protein n=2 Tax=Saccharopolyspora erythraea TaxID=1836 RepID=A4F6E8_SACEN|nr:DedA family protein [Saccharopolyspora erythraea]EQD88081.1 membrane protein [Saccharopolyspora erythraea D]PFG93427.1 membrane protein DedA with SNARE-associated domain [Saccharopolyspora erythraea NRRL 2338]QRK90300.1 DedA family protein [Saccharopolyspora erythraea]CAL99622.1 integral membrane protein [Saccharopolyspora erythraea NRRL 2338]